MGASLKPKLKKRLRKFCLWTGSMALIALIIVALLPVWLPWVLSPVLEKQGGHLRSYQRVGWSRFAIGSLTYTNASVTFSAKGIETYQPVALLLDRLSGPSDGPGISTLNINEWALEIHPRGDRPRSTNAIHSVAEALDLATEMHPLIRDWIRQVDIRNGTVRFSDQTINVPEIRFQEGALDFQANAPEYNAVVSGTVRLRDDAPMEAQFDVSPGPVRSQFTFTKENESWLLNGNVNWLTNDFQVSATFGTNRWEPEEAEIVADSFSIPPGQFGIQEYGDLTGSLAIQWRDHQAQFQVAANAVPSGTNSFYVPELEANIVGSVSMEAVSIEQLRLISPVLSANLSAPLRIHPRERSLENPTTFTFQTDLASYPWLEAGGLVTGEVVFTPNGPLWPQVDFEMGGRDISAVRTAIADFTVEGALRWPELRVRSLDVQFDENSSAQIDLIADLADREISEGRLRAAVDSDVVAPFLPGPISFGTARLETRFSGPVTNIIHQGSASVERFQTTGTSPWELAAEWTGTMLDNIQTSLSLRAKESTLIATISGGIDGEFEVREAALTGKSGNELVLQGPVAISVPELKSGNAKTMTVGPVIFEDGSGTSFALEGAVSWPDSGNLRAIGEKLDTSWVADFLETPPPPAHVDSMVVNAHWQGGPVEWDASFAGGLDAEELKVLSASLHASGNGSAVEVEQLQVDFGLQPLLSAKGRFPFGIDLTSAESRVEVDTDGPMDGEIQFRENPEFWDWISERSGWTVADFQGGAAITGPLSAPEASFHFSAAQIDSKMLNLTTNVHLNVTNLDMSGSVTPEEFRLASLNLDLEDQPLSMSGRLPVPEDFWKFNSTNILESLPLNEATAELRVEDTSLASIAEYAPGLVSPSGSFSANLTLQPGFELDGTVRLSGVSTRPISSIGRFQNTDLLLRLDGRRVNIEHFETDLNDQPLSISGFLEIGDFRALTNRLPRFEFHIEGKSVPVARRTGVMLRSDLDLDFTHEPGTPPRVSGNVNLRDSFFLADLDILQFTSVATPEQRPPYFSIDIAPLSTFELDIKAVGDDFMQIRTPVFKGVASADLRIGGTLGEPVALGDVRIGSGTIMFPFSNLFLEQGVVTLSQADPYNPQLLVTATGRSYGFDIRATVSGTANAPTLTLSSTPPLTSEEILLMITAGTIPRDDFEYSSEQKASKLAFFLGKNILQKFGSDQVTEEKLIVRSAEGISETGKVTYHVEYLLSPKWSLIGEYDEYNAVNAGLKFKIIHR